MPNEFSFVEQEVSRRFTELQGFWANIKDTQAVPPAPQTYNFNAGTGLVVVFLYGCLEFSFSRSVRQLSQLITDYSVRSADVSPSLMCLVHEPRVSAVASAGKKTRLSSRLSLFLETRSTTSARIHDEVLAPELQNVWAKSIRDVFLVFGINQSFLSAARSGDYIDRVANDRNAVAHGREPPDIVGSRYTVNEIDNLINLFHMEVRYIINAFHSYFEDRHFISSSARHRYIKRDRLRC